MRKLKIAVLLACFFPIVLAFQNCSSPTSFAENENSTDGSNSQSGIDSTKKETEPQAPVVPEPRAPDSINEPPAPPPIVIGPGEENPSEPAPPNEGLVGKVYYLLNDTGSTDIPTALKDKNGASIAFPEGVDSVSLMIDRGIQLQEEIRLNRVFLPTFEFSDGFKNTEGAEVKDSLGNRIVEAFAFELKGNLIKGPNMQMGHHELALLSDDGATLEADLNGDGTYETMLVNNDGLHSTKLGCSSATIDFQNSTKVPVRLRFYQGPRAHIALSLLFRKVNGPGDAGLDERCGFASPDDWFSTTDNAPANLVDSVYGEIVNRGWFPGESSMFTN